MYRGTTRFDDVLPSSIGAAKSAQQKNQKALQTFPHDVSVGTIHAITGQWYQISCTSDKSVAKGLTPQGVHRTGIGSVHEETWFRYII